MWLCTGFTYNNVSHKIVYPLLWSFGDILFFCKILYQISCKHILIELWGILKKRIRYSTREYQLLQNIAKLCIPTHFWGIHYFLLHQWHELAMCGKYLICNMEKLEFHHAKTYNLKFGNQSQNCAGHLENMQNKQRKLYHQSFIS